MEHVWKLMQGKKNFKVCTLCGAVLRPYKTTITKAHKPCEGKPADKHGRN